MLEYLRVSKDINRDNKATLSSIKLLVVSLLCFILLCVCTLDFDFKVNGGNGNFHSDKNGADDVRVREKHILHVPIFDKICVNCAYV